MFHVTKCGNGNTKTVEKAVLLRLKSHVTLHIFWKYITDGSLKMPCVGIFVVHFIYTLYALCIETKINCVNHNKGKVAFKI